MKTVVGQKKEIYFIVCIAMIFILLPNYSYHDKYVNNDEENKHNNENKEIIGEETPFSSSGDPNGRALSVINHATFSNCFYPSSLPINVTYNLIEGWSSNNSTIYYEGVACKKDWMENGGFDIEYSIYPWTFIGSNLPALYHDMWQYGAIEMESGYQKTVLAGDYGYYEYTFDIDEKLADSKLITFSYDYYNTIGTTSSLYAFISVIIDGIAVSYNISFSGMAMYEWDTMTLNYDPTTYGHELPNEITLRMGINATSNYYSSDDREFRFDNAKFLIWTDKNQQDIVIAKDLDTDIEYSYVNESLGAGYCSIYAEKNWIINPTVKFEITSNIAGVLDFDIENITIITHLKKESNTTYESVEGTNYEFDNVIIWKGNFLVNIPFNYEIDHIEIEKPIDWNMTKLLDGYLVDKIEDCTGINIGETSFILPELIISNGEWSFEAESINYIKEGYVYVWNGTDFQVTNKINDSNTFIIKANLNNSVILENTLINITIFNPNKTIFYQGSKEPVDFNVEFGNFTAGLNMSIGTYSVSIEWTNNLSNTMRDKVGIIEFDFHLIHRLNITTENIFIEKSAGEPLLIKVKLFDMETNLVVNYANVGYNTSYDESGIMTYIGTGTYIIEVDTHVLTLGTHNFTISANKTYYDNTTSINLISLKIVAEPLILQVPRFVHTGSANDYIIFKFNLTGEISKNYVYPANITCDWMNYTLNDYNNGSFVLNVSTYEATSGSTPETFSITIYANKTDFGKTSDIVFMTVNPISTSIICNTSILEIYKGNIGIIEINYTIYPSEKLISNSSCFLEWEDSYQINNLSGRFIIQLNSSNLDIDVHTVVIRMEKPGYQTQIKIIFVIIQPIESELIIQGGDTFEINRGDILTLVSNFVANDEDILDGEVKLHGDIEGLLEWNGTNYIIDINTVDLAPKIYYFQMMATSDNVGVSIRDIFVRIIPISLEINIDSTAITLEDKSDNSIEFSIYDINHNLIRTDLTISCKCGDTNAELIILNDGTYYLDLNQFNLKPSSKPYDITITVLNPYGEDCIQILNIFVPMDNSIYFIVIGAISSILIISIISYVIYAKFIKLTKFQRSIIKIKKNLYDMNRYDKERFITKDKMLHSFINEDLKL